ncbi:hypothetical protein PCA20602_05104 [Pandoraea capi]|uniref:Uncharacterized protein n=1 Tax=Pandoraea capi TaxID=2508286 RepID=A0ABY6WDI4_9BURK|nr:hypothetical protein [Pandoraea capi]VVE56454.1 hypothetical protein PCA20602_05104 [Pandoraea capi]
MVPYSFDFMVMRFALDKPGLSGEADMKNFTFRQRLALGVLTLVIELVRLTKVLVLLGLTINYYGDESKMGLEV